jgi:heme exporter protein C
MLILILIAMTASLYLIFIVVPTDVNLGISQRIFYIHVPLAVLSLIPPILVFATSMVYLVKRSPQWDAIAHSSVEVGLLFTTLALITGSIWARPTWGVWWTWDPVLTTFLILWLVYLGYLLIRSYSTDPDRRARFSAIVGILGSINALTVYLASELWRTIHPDKVIGPTAQENALDPSIQLGILVSFIAILLLFVYTIIFRTKLHTATDQIGSIQTQLDDLVHSIVRK